MPTTSPFSYCTAGHDLNQDDAYVYLSGGNRQCRRCAIETKGSAGKRTGWKT